MGRKNQNQAEKFGIRWEKTEIWRVKANTLVSVKKKLDQLAI